MIHAVVAIFILRREVSSFVFHVGVNSIPDSHVSTFFEL